MQLQRKRNGVTALLQCRALILALCSALASPAVKASDWRVGLETGGVWQSKNDARIPGDSGTRFALDEITGGGPFGFVRINADVTFAEKHSLRFVYAPLRIKEQGTLDQPVQFAGDDFPAGDTTATYQFNAHRISYRYQFLNNERWQLMAGITALIRDAEIRLAQDGNAASDSNVGVVPLAHFAGHYRLSSAWKIRFDLDAAAASQGRAIDTGAFLEYDLNDRWGLFIGARVLEGGADNDEVYNFAQFNYAVVGTNIRL